METLKSDLVAMESPLIANGTEIQGPVERIDFRGQKGDFG